MVKYNFIEYTIRDDLFSQLMVEKWWDSVEPLVFDIESIDYRKYLNCPACKDVELYCPEHRQEVEMLIKSKIRLEK